MRWLTNFYEFRFKWTATAGIGIHPTKAWLSQLVNFKNAIWTLEERPRDQETEFPVEACWLTQTQEGQTEQIHHKLLTIPFFDSTGMIYMHWVPTGKDSPKGILCWVFKGVQEEIPSKEASTLQIGSVAFRPGQCTSPQLLPCHRLFDQDGHQDSSSASL